MGAQAGGSCRTRSADRRLLSAHPPGRLGPDRPRFGRGRSRARDHAPGTAFRQEVSRKEPVRHLAVRDFAESGTSIAAGPSAPRATASRRRSVGSLASSLQRRGAGVGGCGMESIDLATGRGASRASARLRLPPLQRGIVLRRNLPHRRLSPRHGEVANPSRTGGAANGDPARMSAPMNGSDDFADLERRLVADANRLHERTVEFVDSNKLAGEVRARRTRRQAGGAVAVILVALTTAAVTRTWTDNPRLAAVSQSGQPRARIMPNAASPQVLTQTQKQAQTHSIATDAEVVTAKI